MEGQRTGMCPERGSEVEGERGRERESESLHKAIDMHAFKFS